MDFRPAIEVIQSLSGRLGLTQATFFLRARGKAETVELTVLGDAGVDPSVRAALPTFQTDPAPDNGVGTIRGPEVLLSFRTSRSDDIGLYLRLATAPDDDRQDQLRHLRLVLDKLFEAQARERTFSDDMEAMLRILTHDLKSPTNAVTGFVDILFEDYGSLLPEGVRELLQRVRSSAMRLSTILEGVYRLRVATFGPLRPVQVQLGELASDTFRRVRERHADIPCEFVVSAALPAALVDPEKLDLALGALIDNAFKFREKSRPLRIEIGYASLGPRRHSLVFTDNSLGFDERFRDAVFEPFRKLHPPSEYPGAGVGLTVARTCLAQHAGEVRITSSPSEGVRAVLTFAETAAPITP